MRFFPLRKRGADAQVSPVDLPRDEMAFRKQYESMLLNRTLTTVFRPGNRVYPAWRGYAPGETVQARIIERVGSDAKGIPPAFTSLKVPIRIEEVKICEISSLSERDFEGSSPDVRCAETLRRHLEDIYDKPLSAFADLVSRICFTYLDPAEVACRGE